MSTTETPVTALANIETLTPPQLFAAGALDPIIHRIKQECLSIPRDISTPEGRKLIASTAFKIARSKTYIDKQRELLVHDKKKEVAIIDREGRRVWDELESFQKEFRKPLTDWENAEKERVAGHEGSIIDLQTMIDRVQGAPIASIEEALEYLETYDVSSMEEFTKRATEAQTLALLGVRTYLTQRRKEEADAAELARLRKEAAERAEKDRIETAAREAREQAEREAKEREMAAQIKADWEREQAHREQMRIESEKKLAEERAAKAEQDRIKFEERTKREMAEADKRAKAAAMEAEKKAEADRAAAAKQAEADKKAAVEAERQRVKEAAKKLADEAKARKRDAEHKATIHNDILAAFALAGISEAQAKALVVLLAKGKVPHVAITY